MSYIVPIAAIRKLAAEGKTKTETARALGVTFEVIDHRARLLDIPFRKLKYQQWPVKEKKGDKDIGR